MKYQVTVNNIGTVIDTDDYQEAARDYNLYKTKSILQVGMAADEEVILWRDGEPFREYHPEPIDDDERAQVEENLRRAGIIEDPDTDGGLTG